MALPFDDFFRRMTGMPMQLPGAQQPSGPVNAQTPTAATVAGPALQAAQADDYRDAMLSRMGQLGMMLVAAGQRMTPKERATILAQAPQYMDGVQRDAMTAAQARLMNIQTQNAQQEQTRQQAIAGKLEDPAFLKNLGISGEQAQMLGVPGVMKIMESRLGRDPVQEAYLLSQMQQMQNPKWQITGQDDFGRPRYDLVAPGGAIVTPQGANHGGSNSLMEQLGNAQGPEALAKLKQINPAIAAEVDGIVNARQPFPSRKLGTPEGAMLNSLVSLVDQGYNASTFDARKKALLEQGSNQPNSSGGIRKNAETALRHFKNLIDNSDLLPENHWGPLSTAANSWDIGMKTRSGDAKDEVARKLGIYNNTLEIGGDEMAKALGIASEGGREAIKQMFDPSQGKGVVQQKIKNQIKLLGEKLQGQQEDWDRVMGPAASQMQIVKPDVAEILKVANGETAPAGAVPNDAAIQHLRANPALRDAFDQKYGAGAAAKVLGR